MGNLTVSWKPPSYLNCWNNQALARVVEEAAMGAAEGVGADSGGEEGMGVEEGVVEAFEDEEGVGSEVVEGTVEEDGEGGNFWNILINIKRGG